MNWFIEHETPNGYETIFRGTIEACINEFSLLAKHMDNTKFGQVTGPCMDICLLLASVPVVSFMPEACKSFDEHWRLVTISKCTRYILVLFD